MVGWTGQSEGSMKCTCQMTLAAAQLSFTHLVSSCWPAFLDQGQEHWDGAVSSPQPRVQKEAGCPCHSHQEAMAQTVPASPHGTYFIVPSHHACFPPGRTGELCDAGLRAFPCLVAVCCARNHTESQKDSEDKWNCILAAMVLGSLWGNPSCFRNQINLTCIH